MAFADGNGIRHTLRRSSVESVTRSVAFGDPFFGHPEPAAALRSVITLALIASVGLAPRLEAQSPAFARFVDRYLDDFARRHSSIAAGNGIHDHDDRLDDFSAAGIAAEVKALERDTAELRAFDPKTLTPDERVDQRILLGIIDGWLLEQKTLRNWRRNPMLYASALADGVHNLMTMASDPAPVRMRRIISKLHQLPAFLNDAKTNVVNPPRLFAERGAGFMRGAQEMLGRDLDAAFAAEPNAALRDSLRRAADAAIPQIAAYVAYLERDV